MESLDHLLAVSEYMHLEPAEDMDCPQIVAPSKANKVYVSHATLPNGKRIRLLKTLLTSACERNCYYCPFRARRNYRRVTFPPEEFANLFMTFYRGGLVEGLFLSSGVFGGGLYTQDKLLDTAQLLRKKHEYKGYLHLKIMPGAERDQVEAAMLTADRVSVNLEAPNQQRLEQLTPSKHYLRELLTPLQWIEEIRKTQSPQRAWKGRWPSSVTQFVVGAVGESDLELLSTTEALYHQYHLKRAYFSPFRPIPDTPFEDQPAENPKRQYRLYQSSFLLRDYGYLLEEMPFNPQGNLPLEIDPKLAWAQTYLAHNPVEINLASREELLRVPGIGPKGVTAILQARRQVRMNDLSTLTKLGVQASRAAPFLLINGKKHVHQLGLW
ncbi:MAG: radical SAM protein [Chloroflexota bacterium]